jgi:hypothetical protein
MEQPPVTDALSVVMPSRAPNYTESTLASVLGLNIVDAEILVSVGIEDANVLVVGSYRMDVGRWRGKR